MKDAFLSNEINNEVHDLFLEQFENSYWVIYT
jgi:hypothetical protein